VPYQPNLLSANGESTISAINDLDLYIVDPHGGFFWAVSSTLGVDAQFGRPVRLVLDAKAQISALAELKLENWVNPKNRSGVPCGLATTRSCDDAVLCRRATMLATTVLFFCCFKAPRRASFPGSGLSFQKVRESRAGTASRAAGLRRTEATIAIWGASLSWLEFRAA
jgi:hypothetical protein